MRTALRAGQPLAAGGMPADTSGTWGRSATMETPLTPLEFARRSRRLYGGRQAVIDGDERFTYEQFFARCDRWSAELQRQSSPN